MSFWIVSGVLALAIGVLLALALMRGRRGGEPAAAYDLRVYRQQLVEVDRDLARGLIAEGDAERVRTEVSRRILAADAQLQKEESGAGQPVDATRFVALLAVFALVGGSLWLYTQLGAPGYTDMGLETRKEMAEERRALRPSQAEAEASLPAEQDPEDMPDRYRELMAKLRKTVAENPDDERGQALLARNEASLGNYIAAYTAQGEVLRIKGNEANAEEWSVYAELLVVAVAGYVSPEAEQALRTTLEKDPANPSARFFWGQLMAQIGRPDKAFKIWQRLLADSPPDAPWSAAIRDQIGTMAQMAGVRYTPPPVAPPLSGPSAEDMEAAAEMSDEDRQAMIRGMVDQLAERLASKGGEAGEWARLISALGVLGDTERAAMVYDEARQAFAGETNAIELLGQAAAQAGLEP